MSLHDMVSDEMGNHMKTAIRMPESLLEQVRKVANIGSTMLKSLMEEGLRRIVSKRKRRGKFKLRKTIFRGNGLQPDLDRASWDRIHDLSYEGRGS